MKSFCIEILQLSFGIRNELSHSLSDDEWSETYQFSRRHSLIGVMFRGIEKLSASQAPPKKLLLNWLVQADNIKRRNKLVDEKCIELTNIFLADGFRTCILKGQANALYYPSPELRSAGDIDIWVEGDRDIIAKYIIERQESYKRMQFHHIDYHVYDDVSVEVHFSPMILFNYYNNKRLQNIFKETKDFSFQNCQDLPNGGRICSLTYRPNVLMQLVHMYRHLFDGGFGLKQVVDYYYLLLDIQKTKGNSIKSQLEEDIRNIGLEKFAGGLSYVIDKLILSVSNYDMLLIEPNSTHGEMILEDLDNWKKNPSKKSNKEKSKIGNFTSSIIKNSKLWKYYPSDCVWNIIYRLAQFVWRNYKGYK